MVYPSEQELHRIHFPYLAIVQTGAGALLGCLIRDRWIRGEASLVQGREVIGGVTTFPKLENRCMVMHTLRETAYFGKWDF